MSWSCDCHGRWFKKQSRASCQRYGSLWPRLFFLDCVHQMQTWGPSISDTLVSIVVMEEPVHGRHLCVMVDVTILCVQSDEDSYKKWTVLNRSRVMSTEFQMTSRQTRKRLHSWILNNYQMTRASDKDSIRDPSFIRIETFDCRQYGLKSRLTVMHSSDTLLSREHSPSTLLWNF